MLSIRAHRRLPFGAVARPRVRPIRRFSVVLPAIVGAWLVAILAEATGNAGALHHHALIEGGTPLAIAAGLFLAGWLVMIVAMMLPSSLVTLRRVDSLSRLGRRPVLARAAFLVAFVLAWTVFGLLAFAGDAVLHRVVDTVPALAARPWLIEGSVLVFAGAYQLAPVRRRSLAACRHPADVLPDGPSPDRGWFRAGLDHGLACLGSSGALMLLMFAEGFANLLWMAALTGLMAYEVGGRHGPRVGRLAGVGLVLAGSVVLAGALPGSR